MLVTRTSSGRPSTAAWGNDARYGLVREPIVRGPPGTAVDQRLFFYLLHEGTGVSACRPI